MALLLGFLWLALWAAGNGGGISSGSRVLRSQPGEFGQALGKSLMIWLEWWMKGGAGRCRELPLGPCPHPPWMHPSLPVPSSFCSL